MIHTLLKEFNLNPQPHYQSIRVTNFETHKPQDYLNRI
jgi:hypothetical protein